MLQRLLRVHTKVNTSDRQGRPQNCGATRCDFAMMTSSSFMLRSCALSGFFGASAGAAGKLTFDPNLLLIPHRLTSLVLLLVCNILALHHFNGALRSSGATVQASVVATAANLVVTVSSK